MLNLLAQVLILGSFLDNLYVADFFDVLIIALLIYFVIFLFKQTRSFYVASGVGIVVVIYALAQFFNLFLTSLFFQAFFGVFFIALVVIFQEELRKFFEYLARWSTRQVKRGATVITSPHTTELINAIKQLAREKTGALLVLKGKDAIDNFISGGRDLDGMITEELLLSLFDPGSPGHDGAAIITRDRVALFGGHLPLSHDFEQIGKRGTRHAAALGLSEQTDAFVVVVSEEKGTVSYAYKGKLKALKDTDELTAPLGGFLREKYPEQTYTLWENLLKRNSPEKIVSILLASVMWFFFSFQAGTIQRDFTLPVTYKNTGDTILIEDTMPKEVTVTLAARGKTAFDFLDTKSLLVTIDSAKLATGTQKIALSSVEISRPSNFSVIAIAPQEITVAVRSVKLVELAIQPKTSGGLPAGFGIISIAANPTTIRALVPIAWATSTIATEPIALDDIRTNTTVTTKLILPKDVRLKDKLDPSVEVKVEVRRN